MIAGFWHVAQARHWRAVVAEQAGRLRVSGLLAATQSVQVGCLGAAAFPDLGPTVAVRYRADELTRYEFPTLQLLWRWAQRHEGLVWYIHTKGVCNPRGRETDDEQTRWRHLMEAVVLDHWPACRDALATHEVAGPFWSGRLFTGNFWWATTRYVRRLVEPVWQADRLLAEKWIVSRLPPGRPANVDGLAAPGGLPVLA